MVLLVDFLHLVEQVDLKDLVVVMLQVILMVVTTTLVLAVVVVMAVVVILPHLDLVDLLEV